MAGRLRCHVQFYLTNLAQIVPGWTVHHISGTRTEAHQAQTRWLSASGRSGVFDGDATVELRSAQGLVSRVSPVHTAVRNCTRDEGGPFEIGNQVLISSHRKLLSSKAMVVNVAEKSEQDFDRYD